MHIHGVELIEADDMVINHQRRTGLPFEAESVEAWVEACQSGTALDVGAYTGLYSLLAAKNGASAVAFEPNKAVFERLQRNIAKNGLSVEAICGAVGSEPGRCTLKTKTSVRLTSAGHVEVGAGDVPVYTLDAYNFDDVSAIKIDVEGAECQVMLGAEQTIRKHRPLVISEALTSQEMEDQAEIMERFGYKGRRVDQWNVIWE